MSKTQSPEIVAGVSSAAVKAKTGKTWPEWIACLDAERAQALSHKEIVALVRDKYGVGPWWQQMVTVGYEQARHGRRKHERPDGYQISANKTINVPLKTLYRYWHETKARSKWLDVKGLIVRKATPDKSLRLKWIDGQSPVSVNFYAKGAAKSQVAVEHSQLKSARQATQLKKFWGEKLNTLKALLER